MILLVNVLIALIIVGLVLWLVDQIPYSNHHDYYNTYNPFDGYIHRIIRVVIIVVI